MADRESPDEFRATAIGQVGAWLAERCHAAPLGQEDLAKWRSKGFIAGWRFSATNDIAVDFLVDDRFPRSRPRVAWVNPPPFPSVPHVEDDGRFCALTAIDELDHNQPIGIAKAVLGALGDILEQGLAGANVEDFRTEFLSYWNPTATGPDIISLLDPSGPSRAVSLWRGRKALLVAENSNEIRRWLRNRYGKQAVAASRIESALLLWLEQPLLPADYPKTPRDLITIAASSEEPGGLLLDHLLSHELQAPLILLGANAGTGACFAGVSIVPHKAGRRPMRPRIGGFRPQRAPGELMLASRLTDGLLRSSVERADAWWVHGRDSNVELVDLLGATVGIVGCGSLGSPVARLLAQAGVGTLRLIDGDLMSWPNVGRHVLGAQAVNKGKAAALADDLSRDFPHLRFESVPRRWQLAEQEEPKLLSRCDVLVSTIGSWSEESELNEWHFRQAGMPPIVYGWSEPYAVAGQAVAIGKRGGCLACGLSADGAIFTVAEFQGPTLEREAACGAFFQPYGASDIMAVATLVANLAVDVLCDRAQMGMHRLVAARADTMLRVGGQYTTDWIALSKGRDTGGNIEERTWQPREACPQCAGRGI